MLKSRKCDGITRCGGLDEHARLHNTKFIRDGANIERQWIGLTNAGRNKERRCGVYPEVDIYLRMRMRPPNIAYAKMTITTASAWTAKSVAAASYG